jgi:hypothetical protein
MKAIIRDELSGTFAALFGEGRIDSYDFRVKSIETKFTEQILIQISSTTIEVIRTDGLTVKAKKL